VWGAEVHHRLPHLHQMWWPMLIASSYHLDNIEKQQNVTSTAKGLHH